MLILSMLIARQWLTIPAWLLGTILGIWLAKDIITFPFVWRAHDETQPGLSRTMIGERGIAKERLAPTGYIQVYGELWQAETIGTVAAIEAGQSVRVKKMQGLKLYVELDSQTTEKA